MLLLRKKSGQAFGDQMAREQAHHWQVVVEHKYLQLAQMKFFVLHNIAALVTINVNSLFCGWRFKPKLVQPTCCSPFKYGWWNLGVMELDLQQEHRNLLGANITCCHVWVVLDWGVQCTPAKCYLFVLFVVNDDLTFVLPPLVLTKLTTIADVASTPNSDCLVTDEAVQAKSSDIIIIKHHCQHLCVISIETEDPVFINVGVHQNKEHRPWRPQQQSSPDASSLLAPLTLSWWLEHGFHVDSSVVALTKFYVVEIDKIQSVDTSWSSSQSRGS